mmetsp:Transcript_119757/g.298745  ORF Transcript_119757/g.298745 Transcript_119757/m.298745 type:complete len:762 (-) Transcript_119757:130-2415(-)
MAKQWGSVALFVGLIVLACLPEAALSTSLFTGSKQGRTVETPSSALRSDMSPIRKVITLIEEMKATAERDAKEDLAMYDKFMCWCETNEKEKGASIDLAQKSITELSAFIEEAAATEAQLKTEIAGLENDISEDKDALTSASSVREKEYDDFLASEADMKETRGLLKEAIEALSKVQMVQLGKKADAVARSQAQAVLLQLRGKVQRFPKFQAVMQRDLFDFFGSLTDYVHSNEAFLPKKEVASFEQAKRMLPWEKTEEQVGMEANPNELKGAAANAKSYNSRSGGILGLLAEMRDEFTKDLWNDQKADFQAEVDFQNLKAAKLSEIEAATERKEAKEADLADTLLKAAKAKDDREETTAAMGADEYFLTNMRKDCQIEDEQYKARVKVRSEEIVALSETLKILTEDEARDLYSKTSAGEKPPTFLQLGRNSFASSEQVAAQERAVETAMQRIATIARKHKNWSLVSLAVRMRLDAFKEVKAAMDKMFAELQKQQEEEYAKWEFCKKNLDQTEDEIKVAENTNEDLDEKHTNLVNTIETLTKEIAVLKADEAAMEVALKEAGEERKAQNELYQAEISDQRATTNILNKALARLKQFYTPELLETRTRQQQEPNRPGFAVADKPAEPKDYAKSAGAGGVLQLLQKVIEDAEVAEQQLEMSEQKSQENYAAFVSATTATMEADRSAIAEKSEQVAATESEKSATEEAQLSNKLDLESLNALLKAHHVDCDWLIQYFDLRQKSRNEEMDAIVDAKAVLSGANFGK